MTRRAEVTLDTSKLTSTSRPSKGDVGSLRAALIVTSHFDQRLFDAEVVSFAVELEVAIRCSVSAYERGGRIGLSWVETTPSARDPARPL